MDIKPQVNTEDKLAYCEFAAKKQEPEFVEFFNSLDLDFKAEINSEKSNNPYTHDLTVFYDGKVFNGDLKSQTIPFYNAHSFYNIDPQWAVTYNKKDYLRYKEKYSSKGIPLLLMFDINRIPEHNHKYHVKITKMRAIFVAEIRKVEELIESGSVPLHEYQKRRDDTKGNAKDSYVLDIRKLPLVYYSGKATNLKI